MRRSFVLLFAVALLSLVFVSARSKADEVPSRVVIVSFDGKTVATPADLQGAVASTPIGKKVRVELLRARARRTVEVTLVTMPERKE